MYSLIISALRDAAKFRYRGSNIKKHKVVIGWNSYVCDAHSDARSKFSRVNMVDQGAV